MSTEKYDVVMACGAKFENVCRFPIEGKEKLLVFHTDGSGSVPKHSDGKLANCLGCKHRRAGKREMKKCFPKNREIKSSMEFDTYITCMPVENIKK